jgi:hypothetical protein
MKTHGKVVPRILDLGTTWRCVVRITPGEIAPRTQWIRGWVGPHSRSGRCGKEKNLALPGMEPGSSSP